MLTTVPNSSARKSLQPLTINEEVAELRAEVARLQKLQGNYSKPSKPAPKTANVIVNAISYAVIVLGVVAIICLCAALLDSRPYGWYRRYYWY